MAVLLGVVGVTVAIDLLSKQLVVTLLTVGRRYAVVPGIRICRLHNERGSVSGLPLVGSLLMWAAIVACVAVGMSMAPTTLAPATIAGLGLSVGGATGNLLDRLLRGSVVDFVVAFRWRVLNLADLAILAGLLLTLGSLAWT